MAWLEQHSGLSAMLGSICRRLERVIELCAPPPWQSVVSKEAEFFKPCAESTQRPHSVAEHKAYRAARNSVTGLQELLSRDETEAGMLVLFLLSWLAAVR